MLSGLLIAYLADRAISRDLYPLVKIRQFCNALAQVPCAAFLVLIVHLPHNQFGDPDLNHDPKVLP